MATANKIHKISTSWTGISWHPPVAGAPAQYVKTGIWRKSSAIHPHSKVWGFLAYIMLIIGIVFGLVLNVILMPSITGIMGGSKTFTGASFSGSASVSDDPSPREGEISAYAYNKIICTTSDEGFVICRAPYTLHTGELFGGATVTFNLLLRLFSAPHEDSRAINMNIPYQIKTGKLQVQYNLIPLMPVQRINVYARGDLFINGENFGTDDCSAQVIIVKTLSGFLEKILKWLGFPVCFLEGTRVVMADGSYKNIEDIEVGDMVLSYDINNDTYTPSMVTEIFNHTPEEMMDYYVVINDEIRVTPNHILYVNNVLTPAGCVKVGDMMVGNNGIEIPIESVEEVCEQVATYNFNIANMTNLYVIEDMLALPLKINAVATSGSNEIIVDLTSYSEQSQQSGSQQQSQGGR